MSTDFKKINILRVYQSYVSYSALAKCVKPNFTLQSYLCFYKNSFSAQKTACLSFGSDISTLCPSLNGVRDHTL